MYKRASRHLRHRVDKHTPFAYEYQSNFTLPKYLEEEFDSYDGRFEPWTFYQLVQEEIEECRIDVSLKNPTYKMWFGKYKDQLLFEIDDYKYLKFICSTFREKNQALVGQALLRMDEIGKPNKK